jgi:hypothetical protein
MPLLRPRAVGAYKTNGKVSIAGGDQKVLDLVLKWIPVEVIAFYQALMAEVPTKDGQLRLNITYAAAVICALWIAFATRPAEKPVAWRQIILSTLAFVFWAAAVQNEVMQQLYHWNQHTGAVVLIFGSILLPIFDGILAKLGVPQNL